MVGNIGHKYTYSYVPTQEEVWVPDSGLGPIIRPDSVGTNAVTPPSLGGHWEVKNIGTTPYISSFTEYSMSGTTETHVRTDAIEYDANGNITKYGSVTYEYDGLNRLTRENNPSIDKTITWCYDVGGNIVSWTEHRYTTDEDLGAFAYEYDSVWKDRLTSVGGQTISYQGDVGNPTTYKGASLTWKRGRLLARYNSIQMEYDADGKRCSKTIPVSGQSDVIHYEYVGNNLIRETKTNHSSHTKTFLYNSQGIVGFVYNGTTYTYRKNLFGDITAIYNGSTKVAEYTYDAWGNHVVCDPQTNSYPTNTTFIGNINPFRYRGYYYDADLGLYYLMSRYYDPATGRFISSASVAYLNPQAINGLNLYVHSGNNPVKWRRHILITKGNYIVQNNFSEDSSINQTLPLPAQMGSFSNPSWLALFGGEIRESAGWIDSELMLSSPLGRIGFSSYITVTDGKPAILYGFAGLTTDITNLFGQVGYAGIGFNLYNIVGAEIQVETLGVGAKVQLGRLSVALNLNIFGTSSITVGWDTELEENVKKTSGITIGLNTGTLLALVFWAYKFIATGDPSMVPA